MSKACSICSHISVQAIDDLADSGETLISISERFHVSKFALSRHCKHRKPEPVVETAEGGSREEIQKWLQRSDDQYLLACANADQRGAIQALIAGLRAVEAQAKSEEREESTPEPRDGEVITIEMIDEILQRAEAEANKTPRGRTLAELQRAPDRFLEIADQLYHDPELFRETEQRCAARRTVSVN